jgi:hypothetical protein
MSPNLLAVEKENDGLRRNVNAKGVIVADQGVVRHVDLFAIPSVFGRILKPDMYDRPIAIRELAIIFEDVNLHIAVTLIGGL